MTDPAPIRILITGSRLWDDEWRVASWLRGVAQSLWFHVGYPKVVIVHGANKLRHPDGRVTGFDFLCAKVALRIGGWEHEPHPADWDTHGKAAGPIRNQRMVDLGATVCLFAPLPGSVGTWDCARRALDAGIPTRYLPYFPPVKAEEE